METTRQNKISRLLQKELSEIFLLQTKSMPGTLVSVSAVRISPDMSIARVYLSVFPSEKAEEMVKNINNNMKSIRYELGTRVRHQLRIIPELKFFVDDSSEIFLLQTKSMPGTLVSVSAVRISPDMSIARVYLSVFPSEKAEEMVKNINNNMKSIRYELGTRVRHQLRIIPELKFFVDDSLDYIEKIDSLLK